MNELKLRLNSGLSPPKHVFVSEREREKPSHIKIQGKSTEMQGLPNAKTVCSRKIKTAEGRMSKVGE